MSEDVPVINRVLDGDVDAFALLVERYQRPVLGFVRNMLSNPHDGEDVAQDAFLAAYRNLAGFDPRRASFATWLFTIARNLCLNALKRKSPIFLPQTPPAAAGRTPPDDLEEKEFFECLDRGLQALPVAQRTVFVLAEFVGLSGDDIARIEDVPVGTVRSRLSRAKETLRSVLREYAGEDG